MFRPEMYSQLVEPPGRRGQNSEVVHVSNLVTSPNNSLSTNKTSADGHHMICVAWETKTVPKLEKKEKMSQNQIFREKRSQTANGRFFWRR